MNLSNEIKVTGKVKIQNGENKQVVKNHIVNDGIIHLMVSMTASCYTDYYTDLFTKDWGGAIGDDTTTTTSPGDISLVGPLGVAPDSLSGDLLNPAAGVFEIIYHLTWNSGSVTGTLGETRLDGNLSDAVDFGGILIRDDDSSRGMFSRLSSADGDFSSFVIDDTVPLTIDWTIRFEFV